MLLCKVWIWKEKKYVYFLELLDFSYKKQHFDILAICLTFDPSLSSVLKQVKPNVAWATQTDDILWKFEGKKKKKKVWSPER